MNSCAFCHFPLKEGQVPKRLLGVVTVIGGSVSIGSPCPDKDSPVKGLNIEDVPVRSLESLSC